MQTVLTKIRDAIRIRLFASLSIHGYISIDETGTYGNKHRG